MRKQVKDGTVAKRSIQGHCRYHANKRHEEKLLGRHSGMGKRKGTRNARCSQKTQHILRIRAHRSILKRYSAMNKISKAEKQRLYMEIKGNRFKSSKNLIQEMVQRRIKEGKDKVNAVLQKKMIEKSQEKRQKKETSAANRIQAKIDALRLQKNVKAATASQSKQIK
ncbi:MAG: 60S ribosomal protein L19 [Marteilia pararefringens]